MSRFQTKSVPSAHRLRHFAMLAMNACPPLPLSATRRQALRAESTAFAELVTVANTSVIHSHHTWKNWT